MMLPPSPSPYRSPRHTKALPFLIGLFAFAGIGMVGYYFGSQNRQPELITPNPAPSLAPPITPSPTTETGLRRFSKQNISFNYPSDWQGPQVYETSSGFRFEIGTDTVYPYGTDITDRTYTKNDSYYITLQTNNRPADTPSEEYQDNSPWLDYYLPILDMKDGQTKTTARSKIIKLSDIAIGKFTGAEYISTLSDTAQTEPVYTREIFLINDNFDTIRISGNPNNVDIPAGTKWQDKYQQIDQTYEPILKSLMMSLETN